MSVRSATAAGKEFALVPWVIASSVQTLHCSLCREPCAPARQRADARSDVRAQRDVTYCMRICFMPMVRQTSQSRKLENRIPRPASCENVPGAHDQVQTCVCRHRVCTVDQMHSMQWIWIRGRPKLWMNGLRRQLASLPTSVSHAARRTGDKWPWYRPSRLGHLTAVLCTHFSSTPHSRDARW
jgi:hypothetical protein